MRIRNDMDESKAGRREKRCTIYDGTSYTYKYCTQKEDAKNTEAGPSGNAGDERRPSTRA
uniref:Uncharacterized protein n=1 Tax=Arundo donax TaxID=35708 RepID=A0A0A9A383_ARUDO